MCAKTGFIHIIVPESRFRMTKGMERLAEYTFNSRVAKHLFCAECGMFLRDAWVDQRLLLPLRLEMEGRHREARRELERLVAMEPEDPLTHHLLGTVFFHQGTLDLAIERYERALELAPSFVLCAYDLGGHLIH